MSCKQLFLLLSVISVSPSLIAVTVNIPFSAARSDSQESRAEKVDSKYGLSGTITRYQEAKSLIFIDGVSYAFKRIQRLTDAELSIGRQIHYNVEFRPSEKMGRITRIWR